MSIYNNILCHNNIVAGIVSCRSMLSILMVSCNWQYICADDTAIISAGLIIETKNDKAIERMK